ncbi:MAG: hypothetical protein ACOVMI_10350 [Chitinophagaceae bacterium]
MINKIVTITIIILMLLACNQNNNEAKPEIKTKDTSNIYPLNVMLDNQLMDLQRSPYYIYKKTIVNDKVVDSVPFPIDSLAKVVQYFKTYNIDTVGKKEFYTESSFKDLSTNSISLVYTTTNPAMEVINQTILLNEETNELKNAFVRVIKKNTNQQIQYNFKPNKSLRISTIKLSDGKQEIIEKVIINWNDTE